MPSINTRKIVSGEEYDKKTLKGVTAVYEVAKAAYGPRSGNVSIESNFGDPIYSHDGVLNVDKVHLEEPTQNMAARTIVQASKSTNVKVGDGTTAAVILAYHLYMEARKLVNNDNGNRMNVARAIRKAGAEVVDYIDSIKKPANDKLLHDVAIISASEEALGEMLADTIKEVGEYGGIDIENFAGSGIYNDIVDGFYFRKGFTEANLINDPSNLESRFDNVAILVCEKRIQTIPEVAQLIDKVVGANIRELVIVGTVELEALAMFIKNRLEGVITVSVVDCPVFGSLRTLFFDDLALYCGAKVLRPGASMDDFSLEMLGEGKVAMSEYATSILNGDGSKEDLEKRIRELEEELAVAESSVTQEAIRERLGRLKGKVALVKVGGATEAEQKEAKERVRDAICAVEAAMKDGVVPGGGTALVHAKVEGDFAKVFKQPFMVLMDSAGHNAEQALWKIKANGLWKGYDLRKDTLKLEDLLEAGVIDPALVIKEVVKNATSVAAELIKTTIALPFSDRDNKRG
jgi:chaperonin GroEL